MRGTYQIATFGIKKLAFLPIQFNQFVGTTVQEGDRAAGMTHGERRTKVAVVFDQKTYTGTALLQLGAGTDIVARAPRHRLR